MCIKCETKVANGGTAHTISLTRPLLLERILKWSIKIILHFRESSYSLCAAQNIPHFKRTKSTGSSAKVTTHSVVILFAYRLQGNLFVILSNEKSKNKKKRRKYQNLTTISVSVLGPEFFQHTTSSNAVISLAIEEQRENVAMASHRISHRIAHCLYMRIVIKK